MTAVVKQTTMRGDWRLGAAANLTNTTAIAARIARAAGDPPVSGADRIVLDASANLSVLSFFGTDADDEVINFTIIGWREILNASGEVIGWLGVHLATGTATLSGSITGAAGVTPNGTDDYFADEIAVSAGTDAVEAVEGVADVLAAHLAIDPKGCKKIEVFLDRDSAASANVLYAEL
jgi:hypothetical protein